VKFVQRFPNAFPFQEVLDGLIKNIEDANCHRCGFPTPFLDYTFQPHAQPICSEDCLIALAERQTGKQLGSAEDYRMIEAPK
jgi:hypothetical protein